MGSLIDRELKSWLVSLGQTDRDAYREIRSLLWEMYAVEKLKQIALRSNKKSNSS